MPNKSKTKEKQEFEEEEPLSLRNNAVHPTCVISEEDIKETLVIGRGFYSTVKFGRWTRPDKKEPERVAIKCIREDIVQDHLAEILREANNMVKLEHDNIIKLYGICLVARADQQCKVKLVTEYASYGSLLSVIRDKDEENHSFFCQVTKLWEFACQIAQGMQYLHSKDMIHFDLAARNVLVVTVNKVRISDFGLARALCHDQTKELLEKPVALAWCAPELFKNQLASKGCDVWSYGVLLWELMSFGEQPWADLSSTEEIIEQADNPYKRLVQPWSCSDEIFHVMQKCWSQEAGERPSFTHIIEFLKKAKPVVVAAKNQYWTARKEELCLQQRTKLTIITRYGMGKYRCQNDKAKIGNVSEGNIDFKATPLEIKISKQKISCPFDFRHTTKGGIWKEHKATGVFPVEVENLVRLAEPKPCPSRAQPADERVNQEYYTPMNGRSQEVEDRAIKKDLPKRQSVLPPIPGRVDLIPPSHSSTLPTRKKKPVPTPRKPRSKLTCDPRQDSNFEWIITINSLPDDKRESASSNAKFEDKETFVSQYKDSFEERNLSDCARGVNGHGSDPRESQVIPKTGTHDEQTNEEADLINFKEDIEHKNPTSPSAQTTAVTERVNMVKNMAANQMEVGNEFLLDIPSFPVVTTPVFGTSSQSTGHSEIEGGLLINLPTGLNVEDQEKPETRDEIPVSPDGQTSEQRPMQKVDHSQDGEGLLIDPDKDVEKQQEKSKDYEDRAPPPLPPRKFYSRSRISGPLRSPLDRPPPLDQPPPIHGSQISMPIACSSAIDNLIDFRTLTYPSSHRNQYPPSSERPKYFPMPLQGLPIRNFRWEDGAKPRYKSESPSSAAKEKVYGEELNEGIAKIQSHFPDKSKDACYATILEYQGDIELILKVLQVSSVTSVTEKDAYCHLGHFNWDVQRTVNYILDG